MQLLTAPPRDGLTADQVTALLRDTPSITPARGLELLDLNLNVVEDISGDFQGGTVTRTNAATIHGTCSLTIARDINYGRQLLRPYMTLAYGGVSARFNGGVYVPRKPETSYGQSVPANAIDGSDRLMQLNRPVGNAYSVQAGVSYLTAIRAALTAAGIPAAHVLLDSTRSDAVLPLTRTWPLLVDSTAYPTTAPSDVTGGDDQLTTWLGIVNDLLGPIGYRGLWVDQDGYFRGDPQVQPSARPVEFAFDFDDPNRSILATSRTKTRDISQVPNVWIFQQNNLGDSNGYPIQPLEGAGQYTVTNMSDGDTSIVARGGDPIGRYTVLVQMAASGHTQLVQLGDAQVAADTANSTTWSVSTSPFPAAWHEDVYAYGDVEAADGTVNVLSTGWQLDYGNSTTPAGDMTHSWQAVA